MLYQKEDLGLASTTRTSPETGIYSWPKCSERPFQTIRGKGCQALPLLLLCKMFAVLLYFECACLRQYDGNTRGDKTSYIHITEY
jgi:hypothetical protein